MNRPDILHKLAPFAGETLNIRVSGNCMEPVLEDGQQVRIRRKGRYLPGDILVFVDSKERLMAHRLLGSFRRQGQLRHVTRADNGDRADQSIAADQVLGAVMLKVPLHQRLRCAAGFLAHALGWLKRKRLRP